MKKDEFVIGVLGGMGTYATIHFFETYAEVFPAVKEWERPRIIIDNRCTMPSRVRAFLYQENVSTLVEEMTDSMKSLLHSGCTKIILACNTSHLFLPKIYESVPELEDKVVHIIDHCVRKIALDNQEKVYLLGSEGTIDSKIYQNALEKQGIVCVTPSEEEYKYLREVIEAVKQNKYTDEIKDLFVSLINRYDSCILGCTELPILYEKYKEFVSCKKVYDPLLIVLETLKEEYDHE